MSIPARSARPTDQEIARRAYERFLARGGEHGHHLEDWAAAEAELSRGYELVLLSPGDRTIELVRRIRELTGLPLPEVRSRIDDTPGTLLRVSSRSEAEALTRSLEELGARLEILPGR